MKRNLLFFEFPKGTQKICINGRSYTREQFLAAQKRERFRDTKGRFAKSALY